MNSMRNSGRWLGPQGFPAYFATLGAASIGLVFLLNRFLPTSGGLSADAAAYASSAAITAVILLFSAMFVRLGYWIVGYLIAGAALEKYIVAMGIKEPKFLLLDLMDTDWRELSGFFSVELLLSFVALVVCSILLVRALSASMPSGLKTPVHNLGPRGKGAVLAACLALAAGGFLIKKPKLEEAQERFLQAVLWPVLPNLQTLRVMKGYFAGEMQFAKKVDQLPPAAKIESSFSGNPEGLVVVFVFGESVRGGNWGLNGYRRNTTPRLAAEPGVINFPDTLSFGTYTQVSAVGMMTPTTYREPKPVGPSFVEFFGKHGFGTWSFISSRPTSVQKRLTHTVEHKYSKRGEAMDLLPEMEAAIPKTGTDNRFVFVYTEGNHFPYNRGYPAEFAQFKPDDHGRSNLAADVEKVINAYDNAVLYTDAFLGRIIDLLRERRAVLIYASDHGDALGEDGKFIRGGTMFDEHLRRVPFFVWVSPRYAATAPDIVADLRANAGLKVSHDHIFPTVMSLAGIRSPMVDAQLDLTSKSARARDFEAKDGPPAGSAFHLDR